MVTLDEKEARDFGMHLAAVYDALLRAQELQSKDRSVKLYIEEARAFVLIQSRSLACLGLSLTAS